MLQLLMIGLIAASSVWVYLDATRNRIGKLPDTKGFFNISAGAWAVATLGLWIVAFPAYLFKRSELIDLAKSHPAEPSGRLVKAALLAAVGLGWLGLTLIVSAPRLPTCASPEARGLLEKILRESPEIKAAGLAVSRVDSPTELSFNEAAERRTCQTNVQTQNGSERVTFLLDWQSKAATRFQIRIVQTEGTPQ